jgi:hypothetical protein
MAFKQRTFSCPSALPDQPDAQIVGVVRGPVGATYVEMQPQALPLRPLIDLIPENVRATEVLRFAAPCAETRCAHFDGENCLLAKRIVAHLPESTDRLRPCAIRPTCRWWHQEGRAACERCPQVITEPYTSTALMYEVAQPSSKGSTRNGECTIREKN